MDKMSEVRLKSSRENKWKITTLMSLLKLWQLLRKC